MPPVSTKSADDSAPWSCCLDRYVPEGWEPRVCSTSGTHRTLILDHGRRCLVFAPVGETLCYYQEAVGGPLSLPVWSGMTSDGSATVAAPTESAPMRLVVRVGPGGVVRLPDSMLLSQRWVHDDILRLGRTEGKSITATNVADDHDADQHGDAAQLVTDQGSPVAEVEHVHAVYDPDVATGLHIPPNPVLVPNDAVFPLDALALLASSSGSESITDLSPNRTPIAGLVPGSDPWLVAVLDAAADNDQELDTTGCLVPIRLVQRGLTLSQSDRARLHAALQGPFANRARALYQLVSAGEWYTVSHQGRRKRIIGVHGRVEDRATQQRLVALLAVAVPDPTRSVGRHHRSRTTIDTPVW